MKKLNQIFTVLVFITIIFAFVMIIGASFDNEAIEYIFLVLFLISLIISVIFYSHMKTYQQKQEQKEKEERLIQERRQAEEKKRLAEERIEQEKRQIEERKRQELLEKEKFLKQQIDYELYSVPVYNFIEQIIKINKSYFCFSPYYWYPDYGNSFLQWLLQRDGVTMSKGSAARNLYAGTIYEKTEILAKGLENKLPEDTKHKAALVYLIVRNNIIKYFHDNYISAIGYEDVKSFCRNTKNSDCTAKALFTYFYIYNKDINLPLMETYKNVDLLMQKEYEIIRRNEIEKSIFGDKELQSADLNKTVTGTTQTATAKQNITIEQIDSMSGREFEVFIYKLFAKRGYKCELTPASGDYGIDVIIKDDLGTKIGIQTKCYKEKVSNAAVQEVYAGLKHYNCDKAMIITNSYFTPAAIQAAKENNVTLWDRNQLKKNLI